MVSLLNKAGIGGALLATAVMVATPASADRWRGRHRGGDVATGALIGGAVGLGVGAVIASGARGGWGGGYGGYGGYGPGWGGAGWNGGGWSGPGWNGYYPRRAFYGPPRRFYRPRCFTQVRFDPYWGRPVPVRICR